ncbi:hypothetical protein [Streptomyces antarcticus]|uniref:hypothetical protein n=1 Tax=Streptomyces antarcticus TaxID=2996458 RepID=UPI00226F116A|nr:MULTISPECIES: hypothetical protein [unclassified Streptomyces]MCY0942289.1 hypothetical protein [Streptomyces sp. H34-AA3]MCZ4080714.1 hypothetical protein [Streptomyces sp. H34-S5]
MPRRRGRWTVALGVFTAALSLCAGGLSAASPTEAVPARIGSGQVMPAQAGNGQGVYGQGVYGQVGSVRAGKVRAAGEGCGGRLARTLPFSTGEVRIYKSRTQACAMAVARVPGERRPMEVSIQPRGGAPVRDAGRFTRYAGPVTVGAISRCVYVKGSVGAGSVDSGWILC